MKLYQKTLFGSAIVFFGIGLMWGLNKKSHSAIGDDQTLSMLCKEEWVPKEALDRIQTELGIRIERDSFLNWSQYLANLANSQGRYDLICTHSFLAKDLAESNWLDRFDYKSLEGFTRIAPEFRALPFDKNQEFFVPLGWNINGFAFEKDSKAPRNWKSLWPSFGKKMSLSHPDLELYVRMRAEGLEIDPQKQGRYNRDPESSVEKFLGQLGSVHHARKSIKASDFTSHEIMQLSNSQVSDADLKDRFKFEPLEDGTHLWFLLIGVGQKSEKKALAREVINQLLLPAPSKDLRILNGFAHVLSFFNEQPHVPQEMRATYIRSFPLRSLSFPELSLEGLPQWESFTEKALQESGMIKKD
ncbi:hypothetical protein GW916_12150 [bacterium]|nr:hypothetical protein [bacterium]